MWLNHDSRGKKKDTQKSMNVYDRKKPKGTKPKQNPKPGSGRQ